MSAASFRIPSKALFREHSPEEIELRRKRTALTVLRRTLTAHEQDLAHLRAQLASFEGRYIRQVGYLYRQLDEWQQRLDDLLISHMPIPSFEEMLERPVAPAPEPIAEIADSAKLRVSLDIRALFRDVAKLIHPDFATDATDALRRTHLMAQANDAYNRNDVAILLRMLHGYEPSTETSQDLTFELARADMQLQQTQADIDAVLAEAATLARSELAVLRETTITAAAFGRDHLAELAARVKGTLGMVMRQFEMESSPRPRKPPTIDPESLLTAETFSRRFGTGRR